MAEDASRPLPKSASKKEFLDALGLSEYRDAAIYKAMKKEAADGWERLRWSKDCLVPQVRITNPDPPFVWTEMTESATWREILFILENASPETHAIYSLGAYKRGKNDENWVIQWLLWHVSRYRISRRESQARKRSYESILSSRRMYWATVMF